MFRLNALTIKMQIAGFLSFLKDVYLDSWAKGCASRVVRILKELNSWFYRRCMSYNLLLSLDD